MKVTANRTDVSCHFQEKLVMTERLARSPAALPENADVAAVYIILIKHHRPLSICCVLTTTTASLTKVGHMKRKHKAKDFTGIQTRVNGKIVSVPTRRVVSPCSMRKG